MMWSRQSEKPLNKYAYVGEMGEKGGRWKMRIMHFWFSRRCFQTDSSTAHCWLFSTLLSAVWRTWRM